MWEVQWRAPHRKKHDGHPASVTGGRERRPAARMVTPGFSWSILVATPHACLFSFDYDQTKPGPVG